MQRHFTQYFAGATPALLKAAIDDFELNNLVVKSKFVNQVQSQAIVLYFGNTVNTDSLGTSAANTAYQNSAIINAAIASGTYKKIIIGSNPADTYLISQPIIPNNCIIEYNCILKIMDSVVDNITADINIDDTSFTTTNSGKYHIGEYVCVTDNNTFIDVPAGNKHWGWGGKIINIIADRIYLDTLCYTNLTVAAAGYVTTLQSVFLFDETNNVIIDQTGGSINGNKAGQSVLHPVYKATNGTTVEAYKQGCCLSGWKCNYTYISDNVIANNASMHGISFSSDFTAVLNTYINIGSVHVNHASEKGIHLKWTGTGNKIKNPVVDDCVYQDGIIFYSTNSDWTCGNLTATNCGRTGVDINSNNTNITINSIVTQNCADWGLDIDSPNVTIGAVTLNNCRLRFANDFPTPVTAVNIGAMTITNCIRAIGEPITYYNGNVKTIVIASLTITGCTGIGLQTVNNAGVPDDCFINGGGIFAHTGVRTDIAPGTDLTLVGVW